MAAPLTFPLLVFVHATAVSGSAAAAAVSFPREALPTRSGYLPIPPANASLYFAFYEATHPLTPPASTPLLVWLEGGPGAPSLVSNFFQIGPYTFAAGRNNSSAPLSPNPFAWNRRFGLLFVDSPLGTGYSAAPSPSAIPTNQSVVAEHILAALQSFFAAQPAEFRARPLYLTGESYAGKTIPAAGSLILATNPELPEQRRINLQGVAIGNGLVHPVAQVTTHADAAYFMGLVNARQRREAEAMQAEAVALTSAGRWREASDARARLLVWLRNATGLASLFDVAVDTPPGAVAAVAARAAELFNDPEVRAALGARAGGAPWQLGSPAVEAAFRDDVMKSAKPDVEALLGASTRVLLYEEIRDVQDGPVAAEAWLREMEWDGLPAFQDAARTVWRRSGGDAAGRLAGYVQRYGALVPVAVYGAGHLVPAAQGAAAQEMIEDWVFDKGLFGSGVPA
ncbi:serine carboxypeptidase-like 50 [Panicum virgatum]|uniref:Carboxypeptidase n=1 Tax=Panicum virgatum TaxID=38727 RepID=A0A8T0RSL6_PANVG|nr:serine carboxypeptidase-like 50 [Panicum virgatum]KAG2589422.1 hypothetical protein PVAP13_5NG364600 [Panicum virgatum]